jgi:DNA (cytosine-5)-methyltransferase 1
MDLNKPTILKKHRRNQIRNHGEVCPTLTESHEHWGGGKSSVSFLWANDFDKYACSIYRKHYGGICEGDIRAVDVATIPDHDLVCAGFPCQSFSIAGKRGGFEDTRGTLFFEICRIARAKRTPYLFLENVKGLLNHDEGNTFQTIIGTLDELGYDCQWEVLNSKDYGVPQNRERVFIIANLRERRRLQVFPLSEPSKVYDEAYSEQQGDGEWVWDRDIDRKEQECQDIERQGQDLWGTGIAPAIDANYAKGNCGFAGSHRAVVLDQIGKLSDKNSMGQRVYNSEGIATSIRAIGGGQGAKTGLYVVKGNNKKSQRVESSEVVSALKSQNQSNQRSGGTSLVVQPILTPAREKKRQNGRRMKDNNEPMFTLTGQDIHGIAIANCVTPDAYLAKGERNRDENGNAILTSMHDRRIRRLTPIECERLQGFPDNWTKHGIDKNGKEVEISDTQRYKCCGNAVTTNVITAIGLKLLTELRK